MRICRESLLTESSRMILSGRKGATAPFSCLPARTGSGRARSWVKGWIPCGYSGQRPEPSESFSSSISTVFKVLLSLFFHGSFFIDYLTLPHFMLSHHVHQTFPAALIFLDLYLTGSHNLIGQYSPGKFIEPLHRVAGIKAVFSFLQRTGWISFQF